MGGFLLNICRTNYCNILTLIFGNFWWHLEISGIWKLEIWKSGNSLELAGFDQFQHIGYFSHSVLITELDFELRISKFQFFWKFLEFLEIVWKYTIFDHFCKVEHIFHQILVTELNSLLKSCRLCNFLEFSGISRFQKIPNFTTDF